MRSHDHVEIVLVAVSKESHCCFNMSSVRCDSLQLVLVVMKWLRTAPELLRHPTAKKRAIFRNSGKAPAREEFRNGLSQGLGL
jgi:hypothetical protein